MDPALDVAERRRRRDRQQKEGQEEEEEEKEEEKEEEGARGTNTCSEREPRSPNALGDVAFVNSKTQDRVVTTQPGSSNTNLGSNALPPSYEEAISEHLPSP